VKAQEFRSTVFGRFQGTYLKTLIDNNPIATVVLDQKQLIQVCNAAFERMFQFGRAEIIGAKLDELVAPGDLLEEARGITSQMLVGKSGHLTTKRRRKDGSMIDVEVVGLPLVVEGALVGAFALYHDITERKTAEAALRSSEERYRELFENANDIIYTHDLKGNFTSLNKAGERIIGFDREESMGMNLAEIVTKGHRKRTVQMIEEAVHLTEAGTHEIEIFTKCSRKAVLEIRTRLILKDGKPDGIQGIARDITERKHAEASLRRLSSRLLTLQDEERRRMARELHDLVGQSLAALDMYLSLIKQGEMNLDVGSRQALSESLNLVEQCSRNIRTFCYLLHPPLLDEMGLVATLRWWAAGFAKRSRIRVELDLPEDLHRLPREIEMTLFRIVQECLTNIHRHSKSLTAAIRIVRESGKIVLLIRDRGCGIPPGVVQHGGDGVASLGVGIAGMWERAKQLGGRLEIDSGSSGTVVKAVLPVRGKGIYNGNPHIASGRSRSGAKRSARAPRNKTRLGSLRRGA
jgi:PAS domain S-box-containing protein